MKLTPGSVSPSRHPTASQSYPYSKFLARIDDQQKEAILASAERRQIGVKEVIVQQRTKASHLFLLHGGRIKYYRVTREGGEVVMAWLVPGDVFGLGALLRQPPPYIGTAEALQRCDLLSWEHSTIREMAGLFPQLSANALSIALRYLSRYANRHVQLVSMGAEQKLARTLLNLGHRVGRVDHTGVEVDVTNQELGALADIGTFTASRLLNRWERKGAVAKKRGKVLIQAPELLPVD